MTENEPEDRIRRRAVRALLLDPEDRILLIQARKPDDGMTLWLTPGGGIDPGETPLQCLTRELREETGLEDFALGSHLWNREHRFVWDGRDYFQEEAYYLVRTEPFAPHIDDNPESLETDSFLRFRWWTLPEIKTSDDLFVPRRLGELVDQLFTLGPPETPIETGI